MERRKATQEVVSFAKRQWKEKRPKTVEARRVKDETLMEFGFPKYIIKTKAPVKFLVSVEYSDTLRIYQFSGKGVLLGAENFEQPFEIKKFIVKKNKLIARFPRKAPSLK
jgi:hypothetical protein